MIVKETEAKSYICPVMSFHHKESYVGEHCRGKTCMAWRETYKDHGFCGMTNLGVLYTPKEDRQIEALEENENDL